MWIKSPCRRGTPPLCYKPLSRPAVSNPSWRISGGYDYTYYLRVALCFCEFVAEGFFRKPPPSDTNLCHEMAAQACYNPMLLIRCQIAQHERFNVKWACKRNPRKSSRTNSGQESCPMISIPLACSTGTRNASFHPPTPPARRCLKADNAKRACSKGAPPRRQRWNAIMLLLPFYGCSSHMLLKASAGRGILLHAFCTYHIERNKRQINKCLSTDAQEIKSHDSELTCRLL